MKLTSRELNLLEDSLDMYTDAYRDYHRKPIPEYENKTSDEELVELETLQKRIIEEQVTDDLSRNPNQIS